jgi:hypothetical protein
MAATNSPTDDAQLPTAQSGLIREGGRRTGRFIPRRGTKPDAECEKELPMTRKLLMTATVVATALTPFFGI